MNHREFFLNCINRAERLIRFSFNLDFDNKVYFRVICCEEGVDIEGTKDFIQYENARKASICRKLEITLASMLMGHRIADNSRTWQICEGAVDIYEKELGRIGERGTRAWWDEAKHLYETHLLKGESWLDPTNDLYLLD